MRTDKGWRELQEEKELNQLTWGKIISEITMALLIVIGGFAFAIGMFLR